MPWNHLMSSQSKLGSMNDFTYSQAAILLTRRRLDTYSDGARMAFTLINLLSLLDLRTGLITTIISVLCTNVLLATAELRGVNSNKQRFDPTLLGILNILARELAVLVNVSKFA